MNSELVWKFLSLRSLSLLAFGLGVIYRIQVNMMSFSRGYLLVRSLQFKSDSSWFLLVVSVLLSVVDGSESPIFRCVSLPLSHLLQDALSSDI